MEVCSNATLSGTTWLMELNFYTKLCKIELCFCVVIEGCLLWWVALLEQAKPLRYPLFLRFEIGRYKFTDSERSTYLCRRSGHFRSAATDHCPVCIVDGRTGGRVLLELSVQTLFQPSY